MTTALTKSVARVITIGDVRYKVLMTADGFHLKEQRKRRGIEVSWSSLISLIETQGSSLPQTPTVGDTGVPKAIGVTVASELREAMAALGRADEAFRSAGVLPPEVLAEVASDPFHKRPDQEPDWFIEPMLTPKELASILRLPQASLRSLHIKSVRIAGEERYRQSVVRAYLVEQEAQHTRPPIVDAFPANTLAAERSRTHPQARRFKSYYNRE